jgi:hypothetical protein
MENNILYQHHLSYQKKKTDQLNKKVKNIKNPEFFQKTFFSNTCIRSASDSVRFHPRFFSNRSPESA